jgi:hypothetical protein
MYLGVIRIKLLLLGSFKDVVIKRLETLVAVGSARSQDDDADYELMAGGQAGTCLEWPAASLIISERIITRNKKKLADVQNTFTHSWS